MFVIERLSQLFRREGRRERRRRPSSSEPGRPLHVLFELPSLDPCERSRALAALLPHLDREHFRFSLVSVRGEGAFASRVRELGFEAHAVDQDAGRYRALVTEAEIDLVVSVGSTFGLPATSEAGVAHLHVFDRGAEALLDPSKVTARQLRELERVIACSPTVADSARRRYRLQVDRFQLVPPAVDVSGSAKSAPASSEDLRRAWEVEDDALVFLSLGDFELASGHLLAILGFERVLQRHPKAVLLCAGDPTDSEYLARCRDAAARLPVRFELLEPSSEPASLFAGADFFVQPVGIDGLRRTTLEAVARGLPLVAPNGADVRDLLGEPPAGVLFRERVNWARRKRVLAALRDPSEEATIALGNAMGRACREAEALKAAAAGGPVAVENAYGIEAIARCLEGVLFAAWSA